MPSTIEDLIAENQRLKAVQPTGSKATLFVISILVLCVLTASFVLAISVLRPATDNSSTIMMIVGIVVPVITALLAATVQQVHMAVNSRLSQLLELTAKSSKAEGQLESVIAPLVPAQHAETAATTPTITLPAKVAIKIDVASEKQK